MPILSPSSTCLSELPRCFRATDLCVLRRSRVSAVWYLGLLLSPRCLEWLCGRECLLGLVAFSSLGAAHLFGICCSFREHMANLYIWVSSQIKLLKSEGMLAISQCNAFISHLGKAREKGSDLAEVPRLCQNPYSQSYDFSSSHVWMWELDHKEGWAPKNWCFQTVVLEKTLESPLDSKEIKPVNPKGNQLHFKD